MCYTTQYTPITHNANTKNKNKLNLNVYFRIKFGSAGHRNTYVRLKTCVVWGGM